MQYGSASEGVGLVGIIYLRLVRLVMSEIAISPTAQMKFILSSTANDAATNQFYNLMHSKTWGEGGEGNNLPQPMQ